jgi:hypothetical protein
MINKEEIKRIIDAEDEGPSLDYKADLVLEKEGDKAEFIKDVVSLANSNKVSHIIIGVEDKTRKLVGLKTSHMVEQLNDTLRNRCDPPISLEYVEQNIYGHQVGVIEIHGENPPYVISVPDKLGGKRTSGESCYISRGMLFIRNNNKNEGAVRANIEKMYENKVKYVTIQADLQLSHEVSIKRLDNLKEVDIKFFLKNEGDAIATDVYLLIQFKNIKEFVQCKGTWRDISKLNDNIPTAQTTLTVPVVQPVRTDCHGVIVKVDGDIQQIETRVIIGATNMRTKDRPYVISLKE